MQQVIDGVANESLLQLKVLSAAPQWRLEITNGKESCFFEFDENNFPLELGSASYVFESEIRDRIEFFKQNVST